MRIDKEIGNVQLMQRINRLKVLDYIRYNGPAARPDMAKFTGLSPSSITNIVSHLIEKKLVTEVGTVESKEVGRKATLVRFNPSVMNTISINIESSSINIALTDLAGEIIKLKEIPIKRLMKDTEIINLLKKEISIMLDEGKNNSNPGIAGIGIAVSGLVDDDEKLIISSSLRWKGLSLKEFFMDNFKLPVYVQNSSWTKALWEHSSRKDVTEKNVIFMDLTMGVGIINFYEQKVNKAVIGELGHTTVKKDGPLCFCGNHGCLEMFCSVDAIINQCNEALQDGNCNVLRAMLKQKDGVVNYKLILEAFEKGDKDIRGILSECGKYLGIGLANVINIFNPQRIIINGDELLSCEFIYEIAVNEAKSRAYEQFSKDLKMEKVNIGMQEAIKGVSLYVTDKLFELSGSEI